MILALDCETTSIDLYHSATPFFVTTCTDTGDLTYWEWEVDPLTREVAVPPEDVVETQELIDSADLIVGQNIKFDVAALKRIGVVVPWGRVRDTLLAAHLLSSNTPHDLSSLCETYLDRSIRPLEDRLHRVVEQCRRWCRSNKPEWKIAAEGLAGFPSMKIELWRNDYWLPRAVSLDPECPGEHAGEYSVCLEEYSNEDSKTTVELWPVLEALLKSQNLWEIYLHRLKLLPVAVAMEEWGLSYDPSELKRMKSEFFEESRRMEDSLANIASDLGHELVLAKSGLNTNMKTFLWDVLKLPVIATTDKGNPCFDDDTRQKYLREIVKPGTASYTFLKCYQGKQEADKALSSLEGYERYGKDGVIHPHANPTGSDTLRWSFSNPNSANISKQGGANLRKCFGPRPGRVWYSADAQNIELRIPAFVAGEEELMDVFDRPDDPPYFGSYHLVIFDVVHPELFARHGKAVKTLFEDTWYQWVKNANFARQYGAQPDLVDATFRVPGASKLIGKRFPKIDALNAKTIKSANRIDTGYVETIPDRQNGYKRGYPLYCSRAESGFIIPTTPFSYFVSGSAMQWMNSAMIRCHALLEEWREEEDFDAHIAAQVHDELLFDFPERDDERAHRLREQMELGGLGIGVPTPVTLEIHEESWAVGVVLKPEGALV